MIELLSVLSVLAKGQTEKFHLASSGDCLQVNSVPILLMTAREYFSQANPTNMNLESQSISFGYWKFSTVRCDYKGKQIIDFYILIGRLYKRM